MNTIRTLKITNFKSIDSLELKDLRPFSVFAGPNGAGKSNFFDALDFVSLFIRNGLETALRLHGGFRNIQSEKHSQSNTKRFYFEIEIEGDFLVKPSRKTSTCHYALSIYDLDGAPKIEEHLRVNEKAYLTRPKGTRPIITLEDGRKVDLFPDSYRTKRNQ